MSRPGREAAERPWRVPLAHSDVPASGLHIDLIADEQVRSRLAKAVGVERLPRLSAAFDVSPHGRDGLHIVGRLAATVEQICGVTLEPLENEVEEAIDVVFRPQLARSPSPKAEVEIPLDDEPEPLENGMVDLGALATEFLILGIDPYPRKPGTVFQAPQDSGESGHPFAALAALSKSRREGES